MNYIKTYTIHILFGIFSTAPIGFTNFLVALLLAEQKPLTVNAISSLIALLSWGLYGYLCGRYKDKSFLKFNIVFWTIGIFVVISSIWVTTGPDMIMTIVGFLSIVYIGPIYGLSYFAWGAGTNILFLITGILIYFNTGIVGYKIGEIKDDENK
jgi:hypothetical protein